MALLEFGFYPLKFRSVWILLLKIWGVWILYLEVSESGGVKSKF